MSPHILAILKKLTSGEVISGHAGSDSGAHDTGMSRPPLL